MTVSIQLEKKHDFAYEICIAVSVIYSMNLEICRLKNDIVR